VDDDHDDGDYNKNVSFVIDLSKETRLVTNIQRESKKNGDPMDTSNNIIYLQALNLYEALHSIA